MTMTEQSPRPAGTARTAALAAAFVAMLLVPLAASAQTVLLLGDDFEGADLSYKNLNGADLWAARI